MPPPVVRVPKYIARGAFKDWPVAGAGQHGYAPVWDNDAQAHVYVAVEAAGAAAAAVAAHVGAGDPHSQYVLESAYTAADVLSKLLTVDGVGSGLDADTLDGWNVGTGANNIIKLDSSAKLPAVDGSQLTNLPSGVTDHGALTGLADDDHTQYALLVGRSGGQTIIGGTSSGNDLTLQSTSHATKGKLLFGISAYNEANDRLGIGTSSPLDLLHVHNPASGNSYARFTNLNTTTSSNRGAFFGIDAATDAYNWLWENRSMFFGTNGTIRMRIMAGGLVAIGTHTATAVLDLAASTTARASLRVRSGVAPTSPNDGDIWQDGTDIKIRIGGVTKTFTLT